MYWSVISVMSTRPNPAPQGTRITRQRGVTSWTRQSSTEPTEGAVTAPGEEEEGEELRRLEDSILTNEGDNGSIVLPPSTDDSTLDCLTFSKVTSQITQHLIIT